jgi:hypothetical protein
MAGSTWRTTEVACQVPWREAVRHSTTAGVEAEASIVNRSMFSSFRGRAQKGQIGV